MKLPPTISIVLAVAALSLTSISTASAASKKPNILFIFSDDHALNAISAYGGRLAKVAPTPNIDRIAREGAIFNNSFCANSICGPSRACILTGKHSHKNGFLDNRKSGLDQSQWTLPKALKELGYTTAIFGKWHLGVRPVGFDKWEVFPGQGDYYNPELIQMDGKKKKFHGYSTDIVTQKAINWLDGRDKSKPFLLMCQHKAPHRNWAPALRHLDSFNGVTIPEPGSLFDNYDNRSKTLKGNAMEIDRHFFWDYDLRVRKEEAKGVKLPGRFSIGAKQYKRMDKAQRKVWDAHFGPLNKVFLKDYQDGKINKKELVKWRYQRYLRMYLATVKGVDESVGTLLKYLDDHDLTKNTIVIYSSDQGFYLGEHGWFDKRWMFEESLKMPFIIRWPGVVNPGSRPEGMIQNIDYAPTFIDAAGGSIPKEVQGISILPILKDPSKKIRTSLYYAYYEGGGHGVPKHFGVRTEKYKLFFIPSTKEWQMFDLTNDPNEMVSVYNDPELAPVRKKLTDEYNRLRKVYDAPAYGTAKNRLPKK